MRVLITGAAGFLASHLADAFLTRGDEVVGVDNFIGGSRDNVPDGVEFYEVDCNNLPAMKLLMRGVDVVYHLAATAHEGLSCFSPWNNTVHGHLAAVAVFAAACHARVRRVVFTSSMARFGAQQVPFREDMTPKPEDPYGLNKVASEGVLRLLAHIHDIEWCAVVPHSIIGPRQRYTDCYRNVAGIMINRMLTPSTKDPSKTRRPIIYGDGEQARCFSFVSDCVDPLVLMATAPQVVGEVVNIGPDEEFVSINTLARTIADILGIECRPIYVPARPQEVKYSNCSADKARKLLGYEPKVKLRDGLKEMVDWIRERSPNGRPFDYHLELEIESAKVPKTWKTRMFNEDADEYDQSVAEPVRKVVG